MRNRLEARLCWQSGHNHASSRRSSRDQGHVAAQPGLGVRLRSPRCGAKYRPGHSLRTRVRTVLTMRAGTARPFCSRQACSRRIADAYNRDRVALPELLSARRPRNPKRPTSAVDPGCRTVSGGCSASMAARTMPRNGKTRARWRSMLNRITNRCARARCSFKEALFSSTLPAYVLDAVSANLGILKSPTVLREENGNIWGWEGCFPDSGCCHGSCTHVWNYAQAFPAPLSATGAHAARSGAGALHGRARPCHVSRRYSGWARRSRVFMPHPTGNLAAS